MKARAFFTPLASLLASLILYLAIAGIGQAHRLSGHPTSLRGKLRLAKLQLAHDRRSLAGVRLGRGWSWLSPLDADVVVHRAWLAADKRYVQLLERALQPTVGPGWLVSAFMCIHRGEGSWTANTGNGYYGGLQMDYGFMRTYGGALLVSKGTADHWSPAEQIAVAIRAYYSGRGFFPWPRTARACGLI